MRDNKGKFIKGHSSLPSWGFQKGHKFSSLAVHKKGVHYSIKTEFKKGLIPWNRGKKLSAELIARQVEARRGKTAHPMSEENKRKLNRTGFKTPEHVRLKQSMSHIKWMKTHNQNGNTAKSGWMEIGGKRIFFRSTWEMNYACYLEWLKEKKQISSWEFETDTFWFENIKRGVRSYLPDFKVFNNNGSFEYHEVKGYMDSRSATKLKRMAKYYPKVKMVLIDKDAYNAVKKWSGLIKGWQ